VNAGITEETSKQVGTFMDIMRSQPLSLALVVMNFLIVAYLFYSGAQQLSQRKEMAEMIVTWSKETDKVLGNCVSIDVMKLVVESLERDRELYRRMLPPLPPQPQSDSRPIHTLFQMPP
jgi:hypothetical protein